MIVVGLCLDVEGDAEGESGDETNEAQNMLQLVEEVVATVVVLSAVAHKRVQGEERAAGLALSTGLSELVRLLSQDSHSNVVSSTHSLLRGKRSLAALELLGNVDDGVVAELILGLRSSLVVARLDEVNQHVVSTALVVGRVLVVVRGGVVLSLKLVLAAGNSLHGLNRVSSVGV